MDRLRSGGRFEALDSVRGLAALVVVINHYLNVFPLFGGPGYAENLPQPGPIAAFLLRSPLSLAWNGAGAVAIFFVLSGFVLALPWFRGRPPQYSGFILRRFCRIYLPYAVAVALAMLLASWLAQPYPPSSSAWLEENWSEPVTKAAVIDHILMLGGHNSFNNAVWSLNHEIRISLLFPVLVLPALRSGVIGAATALALYGTAGAITHFVGWHGAPAEAAATIRFAAFFVLGAILARSADRLSAVSSIPAAWMSLTAGLCCLWLSTEPAVRAIGAALIIVAAILPGSKQTLLTLPLLRWLGSISYSLYLCHLLVLLSAIHFFMDRVPLTIIVAASLVASFPIATLFHHWIEAPSEALGHWLERRLRTRQSMLTPPIGDLKASGSSLSIGRPARHRD